MREPRAAVMIVVEATWEDHAGTLRTIAARLENKSQSGACLRIETPIPVGLMVNIKSPREQFAGTTKYCISEGMEYLVGIRRQAATVASPAAPVLPQSRQLGGSVGGVAGAAKKKSRSGLNGKRGRTATVDRAQPGVAVPSAEAASGKIAATASQSTGVKPSAGHSPPDHFAARQEEVLQTKQHPPQPRTEQEKRIMRRRWLDSAIWSSKPEAGKSNGNGTGEGNSTLGDEADSHAVRALAPAPVLENAGEDAAAEMARSHVEYLPMEEIYLAAGILNLRRGYSINKVVEMLRSEHMRGLSKEMKRAALLMALDAAGISVGEVLDDARARHEALDTYEAGQKKQAEAEWARKAVEVAQIQAELERVQEQYAARIRRHRDAVTREKSAFSSWQTVKQQESQRMAEASELCLKALSSDAGGSRAEGAKLATSSRTM